jgi:hypothetical protein
MTLRTYRVITGVFLGILALSAGNYFLDWGFFGGAARLVMSVLAFAMILFIAARPTKVDQQLQAEREDRLERDREWERTRDKSNDEAENTRVREAIGLPPNTSLERTRER